MADVNKNYFQSKDTKSLNGDEAYAKISQFTANCAQVPDASAADSSCVANGCTNQAEYCYMKINNQACGRCRDELRNTNTCQALRDNETFYRGTWGNGTVHPFLGLVEKFNTPPLAHACGVCLQMWSDRGGETNSESEFAEFTNPLRLCALVAGDRRTNHCSKSMGTTDVTEKELIFSLQTLPELFLSAVSTNRPLRVAATGVDGNLAVGARVTAFSWPHPNFFEPLLVDTLRQGSGADVEGQAYAVLKNNAAVVDEEGWATFDKLEVVGSTSKNINLYFYSEGQVVGLTNLDSRATASTGVPRVTTYRTPLKLTTAVAEVKATGVPTEVVEGEVFGGKGMSITVGSGGLGNVCDDASLEGRIVFALVVTDEFNRNMPNRVPRRVPGQRVKEVLNATAVVGKDNVATFSALHFARSGPAGTYGIVFVCDGVESKVHQIQVGTSVHAVTVRLQPHGVGVMFADQLSSIYGLAPDQRDRILRGTSATIQILDKDGKGIGGKHVAVKALHANGKVVDRSHLSIVTVQDTHGAFPVSDEASSSTGVFVVTYAAKYVYGAHAKDKDGAGITYQSHALRNAKLAFYVDRIADKDLNARLSMAGGELSFYRLQGAGAGDDTCTALVSRASDRNVDGIRFMQPTLFPTLPGYQEDGTTDNFPSGTSLVPTNWRGKPVSTPLRFAFDTSTHALRSNDIKHVVEEQHRPNVDPFLRRIPTLSDYTDYGTDMFKTCATLADEQDVKENNNDDDSKVPQTCDPFVEVNIRNDDGSTTKVSRPRNIHFTYNVRRQDWYTLSEFTGGTVPCGDPTSTASASRSSTPAPATTTTTTTTSPKQGCATSAESSWRMWGMYTCQQMQDRWKVCSTASDVNHAIVTTNCPCTCSKYGVRIGSTTPAPVTSTTRMYKPSSATTAEVWAQGPGMNTTTTTTATPEASTKARRRRQESQTQPPLTDCSSESTWSPRKACGLLFPKLQEGERTTACDDFLSAFYTITHSTYTVWTDKVKKNSISDGFDYDGDGELTNEELSYRQLPKIVVSEDTVSPDSSGAFAFNAPLRRTLRWDRAFTHSTGFGSQAGNTHFWDARLDNSTFVAPDDECRFLYEAVTSKDTPLEVTRGHTMLSACKDTGSQLRKFMVMSYYGQYLEVIDRDSLWGGVVDASMDARCNACFSDGGAGQPRALQTGGRPLAVAPGAHTFQFRGYTPDGESIDTCYSEPIEVRSKPAAAAVVVFQEDRSKIGLPNPKERLKDELENAFKALYPHGLPLGAAGIDLLKEAYAHGLWKESDPTKVYTLDNSFIRATVLRLAFVEETGNVNTQLQVFSILKAAGESSEKFSVDRKLAHSFAAKVRKYYEPKGILWQYSRKHCACPDSVTVQDTLADTVTISAEVTGFFRSQIDDTQVAQFDAFSNRTANADGSIRVNCADCGTRQALAKFTMRELAGGNWDFGIMTLLRDISADTMEDRICTPTVLAQGQLRVAYYDLDTGVRSIRAWWSVEGPDEVDDELKKAGLCGATTTTTTTKATTATRTTTTTTNTTFTTTTTTTDDDGYDNGNDYASTETAGWESMPSSSQGFQIIDLASTIASPVVRTACIRCTRATLLPGSA